MLNTRHLHEQKNLCRNLGIREGGGYFFEGDIFSETYGIDSRNTTYRRNSGDLSKQFWCTLKSHISFVEIIQFVHTIGVNNLCVHKKLRHVYRNL